MRHGHVHNPRNILYGRLPRFPLSTAGRDKIYRQAQWFTTKRISHLYTSPMLRARQTAHILGQTLHLKPRISFLLNEVILAHQGIHMEKFQQVQPFMYDPENIAKGQERVEVLQDRMLRFLEFAKTKFAGKNILAVSHGDPITSLRAAVEQVPFTWEYKRKGYIDTGEFFSVEIEKDSMTCKSYSA